jgi:hypothetical protein
VRRIDPCELPLGGGNIRREKLSLLHESLTLNNEVPWKAGRNAGTQGLISVIGPIKGGMGVWEPRKGVKGRP